MSQLLGDIVLETPYPYLTSPLLQNPGGATAYMYTGRDLYVRYCSSNYSCCHLPNKVENIICMPDVPYTLQWAADVPPKLPFPWVILGALVLPPW